MGLIPQRPGTLVNPKTSSVRLQGRTPARVATKTAERDTPPKEAPSDVAAEPASSGNGEPPKPPPSNGNGEPPHELSEYYKMLIRESVQFNVGGTRFMDRVYPFLLRVTDVRWTREGGTDGALKQGFCNYPVFLNSDGLKLFAGKLGRGIGTTADKSDQHLTAIVRHFLTASEGEKYARSINAGVISRFVTVIWATMVLPRMIADKRKDSNGDIIVYPNPPVMKDADGADTGDVVYPSAMLRSFGGNNPLMSAWRLAASPKRAGTTEAKIPESVVEEKVADARLEGKAEAVKAVESTFYAAGDLPDIADIDVTAHGELEREIRDGFYLLVVKREGNKLRVKKAIPQSEIDQKLAG